MSKEIIKMDEEFKPYYNLWVYRSGKEFDVNIFFVDSKNVFYAASIYGEIRIDRKFWNEAGEEIKEQILFHELAHCYATK